MSLVYLAGPITGLSYGVAIDWREYAAKVLGDFGVKTLNPLRGKDYLSGEAEIKAFYHAREWPLSMPKGITTRDRNDVMTCDLILVNLLGAKRISIGTVIEVGWADAWRKPIVLVMEADNCHAHPMLETMSGFIVDDLSVALAMVKVMLP